jgi:two-component system CheB/CheR fusion protein
MKNLLNSTDIATLFLDKELHIRRFTLQSAKIFKLIKSDIGRPYTDLVSDLVYPELSADALEVLKTLVFIQKPIPTNDGRWYSVRIMPYRTVDDKIDGLVITFVNISDLKKIELKLHETGQMNSLLVNSSSDIILKLSTGWKILEFNPRAEEFFGKKRKDVLNENFLLTIIPEKFQKKVENNLKKLVNEMRDGNLKIPVTTADGTVSVIKCSLNILLNNLKMTAGMILSFK